MIWHRIQTNQLNMLEKRKTLSFIISDTSNNCKSDEY